MALPVIVLVALIALFLVFLIVLLPFSPLIHWWSGRNERKKLDQALAALDAVPVGDEKGELDALAKLRSLRPTSRKEIVQRIKTANYPWRLPLLEFISVDVLEEIARRPDDSLGPVAWHLALVGRFHESPRVRRNVPPEEIEKFWRRALTGPDLFSLPPELEDRS